MKWYEIFHPIQQNCQLQFPDPPSSDPWEKTVFDGRIFFVATNEASGRELFFAAGCGGGDADDNDVMDVGFPEVTCVGDVCHGHFDLNDGLPSSDPRELTVLGNNLFFTAKPSPNAYHTLYKLDDAQGCPTQILPIAGQNSVNVRELTIHGGTIWFLAGKAGTAFDQLEQTTYVWRLDPVTCTPIPVSILPAKSGGGTQQPDPLFHPFHGELESMGDEIAVSAGWYTELGMPLDGDGATEIYTIRPTEVRHIATQRRLINTLTYNPTQDYLYFIGNSFIDTDNQASTQAVDKPVLFCKWPHIGNRVPNNRIFRCTSNQSYEAGPYDVSDLYVAGGLVYFQGSSSRVNVGRELCRSAGHPSQTRIVNVNPNGDSNAFSFVRQGNFVYFLGRSLSFDDGMFRIQIGNAINQVTRIATVSRPGSLTLLTDCDGNETFYFAADLDFTNAFDNEIWASDGDPNGLTIPIHDANPGGTPGGSCPGDDDNCVNNEREFIVYGDRVFFTGFTDILSPTQPCTEPNLPLATELGTFNFIVFPNIGTPGDL